MGFSLETLDLELIPDPSMPTDFWDPRWKEPEVASRVACQAYEKMLWSGTTFSDGPLCQPTDIPDFSDYRVTEEIFVWEDEHELEQWDVRFLGGSFGELHKRYMFGVSHVDFHAQAVLFGVDEDGQFFLQAVIGRVGGTWGKKAGLVVEFWDEEEMLGAIVWQADMDPAQNVEVAFAGQDESLADAFEQLSEVRVKLYSYCTTP